VGKADPTGVQRSRDRDKAAPLASPSTIHRLKLSHPDLAEGDRYQRIGLEQEDVDNLLILDVDATDDKVHGNQLGRFINAYYDSYCFLTLHIFAGDHLLAARLGTSDVDGAQGTVEELRRIVDRIRQVWPKTRIIV
jgi:hypothetical protein